MLSFGIDSIASFVKPASFKASFKALNVAAELIVAPVAVSTFKVCFSITLFFIFSIARLPIPFVSTFLETSISLILPSAMVTFTSNGPL